jgi:hypothetical protein
MVSSLVVGVDLLKLLAELLNGAAAEDDALQTALEARRVKPDAPIGHLNSAIAEELGWRDAISNGEIGIKGLGNVTTGRPEFITYNPETDRINLWDATAGKLSKQLPVPEYWMPEARAAVGSYTGPYAAEIQQALDNGQWIHIYSATSLKAS